MAATPMTRAGQAGSIRRAATRHNSGTPPKVSSCGETSSSTVPAPIPTSSRNTSATTSRALRTGRGRSRKPNFGGMREVSGTPDLQAIPDAADVHDADRGSRSRQLLAQPAHVHIDEAGAGHAVRRPSAVHDALFDHNMPGVLR